MGNLFKTFKTNKNLEREGVWFEIDDGVKFLLARAGATNEKYMQRLETRAKPYSRRARNMTRTQMENIQREVFLDTILLGWEGVTNEEGEPLEFTRGNAIWLFEQLPDVYIALNEEAGNIRNYLEEYVDDLGKPSADTTTG